MIRAFDTPNFVANRVGVAGMLLTFREVEKSGLGYDIVDDLTGRSWVAHRRLLSVPLTWSVWTRWLTSSRPCKTAPRATRLPALLTPSRFDRTD